MPSFDTVSEIDGHEVTNAVDQANRELTQRFDFKGTGAEYTREMKEPFVVIMKAESEFQLRQMLDILKLRVAKRGIDVSCMDVKDPETNLAEARQKVNLKHGIDQESAKKIVKSLKESGLKVQAQIQGDKVRVTGKKRDDLQDAIAHLRKAELGVPLQFENFRE
jgi:cyclic-di-GMP-binding protein